MKKLLMLALFVALASVPLASASNAATATSTLTVTANVSNNCTIAAANLVFGAYDPVVANAASPLNVNSTVTVACTKGATATVGLNAGANSGKGGCATTRAMSSGGGVPSYLCYEIYSNAGLSTVWGNAGAGLVNYTAASKAPTALTDYGQVPAGQDVPTASYSDSVTATITF
jgi:spore coat protein U domain-containing protein, fimbrial subunit CupE1/2/3/6